MSDAAVKRVRARLRGAVVAAAFMALAACEGGGLVGGDPEAEAALAEVAAALGGDGDAATDAPESEATEPESDAAAKTGPVEEPEPETEPEAPAEEAEPEPAAEAEPAKPDPNAAARASCKRRGGFFTTSAEGKVGYCAKHTRDANRPCKASSACEGYCLARSRSCAPVTPLFGCHRVLTDRGVESEICLN